MILKKVREAAMIMEESLSNSEGSLIKTDPCSETKEDSDVPIGLLGSNNRVSAYRRLVYRRSSASLTYIFKIIQTNVYIIGGFMNKNVIIT